MKKYDLLFIAFFTLLIMSSCEHKTNVEESDLVPETNLVEVNAAQFAKAKMELGKPVMHLFSEIVTTKGYLKASAEGKANVSVFLPGRVKNIRFVMGDFVNKGTRLFELEGNEIIDIQQNFAQNTAELTLAKYELDRLEKLAGENIGARKDLVEAQSNWQALKAMHEGFKARLKLLNINPDKVEAGEILPVVSVLAPISGYITQLNIVQGEYLEPQKLAIEIIDTRNLQLYLSVFETDILTLEKGQKVLFYDSDRKYRKFQATLILVGKAIDPVSKTIQCIAEINNTTDHNYVNGMYVECAVVTSEHEAMAVPTDAIIKNGLDHFVLIKDGEKDGMMSFSKVKVEVGQQDIEFTEIVNADLTNVLLKGLYNLNLEE